MLKIKNWNDHQHYKDRNPPWIKLKTNTFQNYEFSRLQDASKLLAICIWTLAARSKDGEIPFDLDYIKRQGNLSIVNEKHLKELIDQGFIYDSNLLADCTQSLHESVSDNSLSLSGKRGVGRKQYSDGFEEFWKSYPPNRASKSEAEKSYNRARKETDHETIIRSAAQYAQVCKRDGTAIKHIAHATTWLNQSRWTIDYNLALANPRHAANGSGGKRDPILHAAELELSRIMEADNSGGQYAL